jgi:hypothetical protein
MGGNGVRIVRTSRIVSIQSSAVLSDSLTERCTFCRAETSESAIISKPGLEESTIVAISRCDDIKIGEADKAVDLPHHEPVISMLHYSFTEAKQSSVVFQNQ